MTKFDMVKQALAHRNTGRVPYTVNLTGESYDCYGQKLLNKYASKQILDDLKNGMLSFNEAVSLAIGNNMLCVYGPWWNWYNVPDYFYSNYDTPEHFPDTVGTGNYEAFFSKVKYIKENYDVYIIFTVYGSHWEKAYFSRGIENFLLDLAGSPEWSKALLDMIIRKNLVMLENVLVCQDFDAVLLGSDWGTQSDLIMSPCCFRTMIKEGEKLEYDLIKKYGKDVFVHSCGNIEKIMDDLVEIGVQALNPVQPECMDIYALKTKYGDKITFFGGISTQQTLPYGTPEQVESEMVKVINAMSVNGGYIIAPSQEIQPNVPYDNLIALIETARTYC